MFFLSFLFWWFRAIFAGAINDVSTQAGSGIYEIFNASGDPRYASYATVGGVTFGTYSPWNTYMDPGSYCPRVLPNDQYNWGGNYKSRDGSVSSLGPDGAQTLVNGYSGSFKLQNNNPFGVYVKVYLNSNYCFQGYGSYCHGNPDAKVETYFIPANSSIPTGVTSYSTVDPAATRCGMYQLDVTIISVSQTIGGLNNQQTVQPAGVKNGNGWCEVGETCEWDSTVGAVRVCSQTGVAIPPNHSMPLNSGDGCNTRSRIVGSDGLDASYKYLPTEAAFHKRVNLAVPNDVYPDGAIPYCGQFCTTDAGIGDADCKSVCTFDAVPQVSSLCQTGIDSGGAPNYCASDVSYKCDASWGSCGCTGRGCRNDYNDPTSVSDTNNGGAYDSSDPNSNATSANNFHTDLRCCHSACVNNACASVFGAGADNNECMRGTSDGQFCGCLAPADPNLNTLNTNINCTDQTATFSWEQINGATSYDLIVYDNGNHTELLNITNINTNSYVWNGARAVYGYDWQIRANRSCGNTTVHSGWVGKTLWTPGVPNCTISSTYTIFPGTNGQLNIKGDVDEQAKSVNVYAWTTNSDGSGAGTDPGALNPNDVLDTTDGRADRRLYVSNGPLAAGGKWSADINLSNHPDTNNTYFKVYGQANSCLQTNQPVPTCGPINIQRINKICGVSLGVGGSFSQIDPISVGFSGNANLSPGQEAVNLKYVKVGQIISTQADSCVSSNAVSCSKNHTFASNYFQPGDYYVYCAMDLAPGACSGDPGSGLPKCGIGDRQMITVLPENPPTISSFDLKNESGNIINPDGLGRNNTCESQITNNRIQISVKLSDLQGTNDIVTASSRLVDTTNGAVLGIVSADFKNGVITSDSIGVGNKYANTTSSIIGGQLLINWYIELSNNLNNTYKIQTIATDSRGLTSGWVDNNRFLKIWDCKVSVSGTVYLASNTTPNCQTGDGFSTQYVRSDFSSINYAISGGGVINGQINGTSQYNLIGNFLYGSGKTYKPNLTINSVLSGSARIKQVGNSSIDCNATVDLGSSSLAFDPYLTASLTVDFSGTEIYPGWWQVQNSNVKSGGNIIDSISPWCGNTNGSSCVKSVGITSASDLSLQGIIMGKSIEGTSGCVDCKKGGPEWYIDNRDYLVPILTYESLLQKIKEANTTVNIVGDYGMSLLGTNPNGVYFIDGTFTVDVNNTVGPGGHLLIVAKKIVVMPNVSNIEGIFIAANTTNMRANFEAQGNASNQLIISGGIYASGDVVFKRTLTGNFGLDNNNMPAIKIIHNPTFLFNLPKELSVGLVNWRER